jgi:hypothetical protein
LKAFFGNNMDEGGATAIPADATVSLGVKSSDAALQRREKQIVPIPMVKPLRL